MDTISGSCEMNDSQGGSFVTDYYHFTHFTVSTSPQIIIKKFESTVKLLGRSVYQKHKILFGFTV